MGIMEELKRDLIDPVKTFSEEVYDDTVGDAARFYSAQARNMQQNIRLAEKRTKEKAAAIRREQEEMKKHRMATMKRAAIVIAVLSVLALIILSLALNRSL